MRSVPTEESRAENASEAPRARKALPQTGQSGQGQSRPAQTRRVLLVSLDFPPRRTSGVYRPTGLAKYLGDFGWNPTVLTTSASTISVTESSGKSGRFKYEDETLLRRLPASVHVERTPFFSLSKWEKKATDIVQSEKKTADGSSTQAPIAEASRPVWRRAMSWAASLVRACLYFPDEMIGWLPYAVARAVQLHQEQKFDVIYTTSPPRSTQMIGLCLKLLLRVPWVMELRDPWYAPPGAKLIGDERTPKVRRWLEARFHSALLRNADAVVVMTDGHSRELHQHFEVPEEKLFVVPNGFDEEDFCTETNGQSAFSEGHIHFSHFGTVYPKFSASFFAGLAGLIREIPELKDIIRVNVIGFPDDETLRCTQAEEFRGVVQFHKLMGHAEAIDAMRASQFLLLFYAHQRIAQVSVPGKLYEYLRAGRPILAVTYEGSVKRFIEEARAGWVLPPDDPQAIQQMLKLIIHDHWSELSSAPKPTSPEYVAQFRYENLAAKLAAAMSGVAGAR